jgi:hypothetical protein
MIIYHIHLLHILFGVSHFCIVKRSTAGRIAPIYDDPLARFDDPKRLDSADYVLDGANVEDKGTPHLLVGDRCLSCVAYRTSSFGDVRQDQVPRLVNVKLSVGWELKGEHIVNASVSDLPD